MPCPFFKNGLCTSPLLGEPRADVYRPGVCDGDKSMYSKCPYYTEKGLETLQTFTMDDVVRKLKPDPLLHYMRKRPVSSCKYMKVYEISGHYVAYCQLLGRLLTRYEAELCVTMPEGCPIRKLVALR
jgi:hypothetical protein